MIIDLDTYDLRTEALADHVTAAVTGSVHWLSSTFTTFRFKALCSRLRTEFSPQVDTYDDPRDTGPGQHTTLPREPTRLERYLTMKPNFQWVDVSYRFQVDADVYVLIVELTSAGVPTGHGRIVSRSVWNADGPTVREQLPYRRTSSIRAVPPYVCYMVLGASALRDIGHGWSGPIRPDLVMPGFQDGQIDLIPITQFDDDWDPTKSTIRYRNLEARRAVPRNYLNPRKSHGPVSQPVDGFSAKQFVRRYCGGGYQVPYGASSYITIGTGLIYERGKTPRLRRRKNRWNRETV